MEKTYYYSIDFFKFIFAVFVVLIHVTAPISQNGIANFENYYFYRVFLNFAVPFFFISSGVFLVHKDKNGILQYLKKIAMFYFTFSIFYILFRLGLTLLHNGTSKDYISTLKLIKILNGSIGSFHLWFLASLIYTSAMIYFLKDRITINALMVLAVIFYLAAQSQWLNNLTKPIFQYGSISEGFFFVTLGMWLVKTGVTRYRYPIFFFIFFSFIYFESVYIYKTELSQLFLGIAIFYLTVICLEYKDFGKGIYFTKLSKYSLGIYILHVAVQLIIYEIYYKLGFIEFYQWVPHYIYTTILCVIVPIIIFNPFNNLMSFLIGSIYYKAPLD